ncbi:hypothetical protein RIF29_30185 [Crotalaria pallida]|uniref:Uncharacterized protein n=1 Tax=Crotalaria pallida TaxID=3830 RepID=A0AAN9EFW2_CROPI
MKLEASIQNNMAKKKAATEQSHAHSRSRMQDLELFIVFFYFLSVFSFLVNPSAILGSRIFFGGSVSLEEFCWSMAFMSTGVREASVPGITYVSLPSLSWPLTPLPLRSPSIYFPFLPEDKVSSLLLKVITHHKKPMKIRSDQRASVSTAPPPRVSGTGQCKVALAGGGGGLG